MVDLLLSEAAQRRLVTVARRAIESALAAAVAQAEASATTTAAAAGEDLAALREELQRRAGAFVTLVRRSDGELRGCVGIPEARFPLAELVARVAVAAALHDGRFTPVRAHELADLGVHVSVLGPLAPIQPEEVEVGVHGLVVRSTGKSGLLLPQVAIQQGWGREEFLDATCRKAGLPPATWRQPWCEIFGFTAVVFGEEPAAAQHAE